MNKNTCRCSAYTEQHMIGTGRCHRESAEDRRERERADQRAFDASMELLDRNPRLYLARQLLVRVRGEL